MKVLKKRHRQALEGVKGKETREKAEKRLDSELKALERTLYGIAYLKELSPRSLDIV